MHDIAMAVGEDLDFDMARLAEIFLHIDGVVAEGGWLRCGRSDRLEQVGPLLATFMPRPPPPAVALISTGIADFGGRLGAPLRSSTSPSEPGTTGMPSRIHRLLGGDLVAHHADMVGRGPDEGQAVCFDDVGELGVLRQEAVAGMDRLGAGDLAGGDDLGDVQIAVARGRRADADAFIGQAHMHGVGVGGGMDRDGGDAHLLAGAEDAKGDFAAIGDEDFLKHHRPIDDGEGLAEFDGLAVVDADLLDLAGAAARGSGSWSSSLRR